MSTVYDLLYLARCAVHEEAPDKQRVSTMDMDKLYKLSCQHKISAMIAMALESVPGGPVECLGADKWSQWQQAKAKSVRRAVLFDAERVKHLEFFEKNSIWYVPLKGTMLKELYPKYGMREMADNDILYDKRFQKKVYKYMISSGYEAKSVGVGAHDAYHKKPIYNFELHRTLFSSIKGKLYEYYIDVINRLVKDEGNDYGYHFSDDDQYIFMTAHAFNHYSGGGTGLRTLVDSFIFRYKMKDNLHFDVIDRELEKLGALDFDICVRSLSDYFLECQETMRDRDLTEAEQRMLMYMVGSGAYGTIQNGAKNRMSEFLDGGSMTGFKKVAYTFKRLFPSLTQMKLYSPIVSKYPISLPVMYVYRLIKSALVKRDRIKIEMQIMKDMK